MEPGNLRLTVLGSDGSYPGPGGACSGYLVQGGGTSLMIDAGSGTLARLQEHVALPDLDAVFVSHSHPDHWTDIEGMAVALKWALGRQGLTLISPRGLREQLRVGSASDVFDWKIVEDGKAFDIGALRLTFSRTDHPVETLAARVDFEGRSIGYSADTGPAWSLSSLGRGIDLALCEATFLSDKEGTLQHLSARQAGRTAAEARAGRLVITHLMPGTDREAALREARHEFGSAVTVAAAGAEFRA
jgi:ribonuclease BN (tRNA processing enzyme)